MLKVGLDTNVLVDFVLSAMAQQFVLQNIFHNAEIVTCNICIDEAKRVLESKHNIKNAEEEIKNVLQSLKIKVIDLEEKDFSSGVEIEREFKHLGAHKPDVFIIACFKNNGVTDVFTIDYNFVKIIGAIGMRGRKVPNLDRINEIMFKKMLKG
ncbi:PIN domain-containing protein [Candidatus Woesearchaeota archaeon]|nr:PIN domain-containing protein [Candidatus Woesearchaeota archaeon]